MKDCIRFAPMIGAREGELTAAEAAELAKHLSACDTCQAIAADFAATDGLVRESLTARANARDFAPFVDRVMARVEFPPSTFDALEAAASARRRGWSRAPRPRGSARARVGGARPHRVRSAGSQA